MTDRSALPLPLHAELLLLAHDPATGRRLVDAQRLKAGLAGAALLELNLQEALRLEGTGRAARLRATGADVHPDLLEVVRRADGHAPKKAVARIGGAETFVDRGGQLRDATWRSLEAAGLVRSEEGRTLGLFPTHRRVQTTSARSTSLDALRRALAPTAQPDLRTAGLVAVAHATGLLGRLVPELGRKQLAARVAELAEGGWSGDAVAKAISDVQVAVVAAVMVPIVVTASG